MQTIENLQQFYDTVLSTVPARRRLTQRCLNNERPDRADIDHLHQTLEALLGIPGSPDKARVVVDKAASVELRLEYEVGELHKDLVYLREGEDALVDLLRSTHPGFDAEVKHGVERLSEVPLRNFISDRDGTTNNYCSRYLSSVQSVYNAVMLSRYVGSRVDTGIILTSAPLQGPGLTDISVAPDGLFVYAGSKGREYVGPDGKRHTYAIAPQQQSLLDQLNRRLDELVDQPRNRKYGLIGSGVQHKFGQTTVARQDIDSSVPQQESEEFLAAVRQLVEELDPSGKAFRIEDTGKDIEIMLTIATDDKVQEFDKGSGIAFLAQRLELGLDHGGTLVCGDTASDVPMLSACLDQSPETWSVFVTKEKELRARVRELLPNAVLVGEPDALILILNRLATVARTHG